MKKMKSGKMPILKKEARMPSLVEKMEKMKSGKVATRHPTLLSAMKQGVCSRTATAAITADGVGATVLSKTRQPLGMEAEQVAGERELGPDAGAGCAGVVAARGADELAATEPPLTGASQHEQRRACRRGGSTGCR